MQLVSDKIFSLTGNPDLQYDTVGVMQYRSRQSFLDYVSGSRANNASGKDKNSAMSDGFTLRTAGLATQGLIAMLVESDSDSISDPDGPKLIKSRI